MRAATEEAGMAVREVLDENSTNYTLCPTRCRLNYLIISKFSTDLGRIICR
jgi:hypothetical protein